jgi:hypothetical protein
MKRRKFESNESVFDWQRAGNRPSLLANCLRRLIALREGGLTRHWVLTAYHFGAYIARQRKTVGVKGVVIYLKGCYVLLQQVVGNQVLDNPRRLGCAISRSRSGLPRLIPVYHRKMILSGDKWTVKIWTSFFWLYRVLEFPGRLKLTSITKPFELNHLQLRRWVWWLAQFLPIFFEMIGRKGSANIVRARTRSSKKLEETSLPDGNGIPIPEYISLLIGSIFPYLTERQVKDPARRDMANSPLLKELKPSPVLISKSGPNSAKGPDEGPGPNTRTNTGAILTDIMVWLGNSKLLLSLRKLWPEAVNCAMSIIAQAEGVYREIRASDEYGKTVHEEGNSFLRLGTTPLPGFSYGYWLGKLGFLPEPAGKIRVFAMVDSLTQMLLMPLHKAIFEILKKIPQDGTHDQHAPAKKLAEYGFKHYWSYDLSAATDRFPISLQQALLGFLLGPEVARSWRSILVDREYKVPRWISEKQRVPRGTPETVHYGAGQPMGAYTSWAVFALTHHFLVQYAAYRADGKLRWFEFYALLGDDVVLANAAVAREYLSLLQEIGVEVGLAKSLISRNGTFEFAKRTYRAGVDVSGISLTMLGVSIRDATVLEELLAHCNARSLHEALRYSLRVLGYKGRALTSIRELIRRPGRLQGLSVLLSRPSSKWGLSPLAWFTQYRVDFSPPLAIGELEKLVQSLKERLCSEVERLISKRDDLLVRLSNPRVTDREQVRPSPDIRVLDYDGKPFWLPHLPDEDPLFGAPYTLNTEGYVKLTKFLTDWVVKPQVQALKKVDLSEYITDLEGWKETNLLEVGMSLDDIYKSLDRAVHDLEGVETTINKLIRDQRNTSRKMDTKIRTKAVKLWRGCRSVIAANLTEDGSKEG